MNEVYISGKLLNHPCYDVIPATSDAIIRGILQVDTTVLPMVCCNELAASARQLLLDAVLSGEEIYAYGELKSSYYIDVVGSRNYFLYLIVHHIAMSKEAIRQMEQKPFTPLQYQGLPFGAEELEVILNAERAVPYSGCIEH